MRKLLVYLRDYKLESTLGPLFKLLEAVFELFVPLVVAAVIDQGIRNSDKGYVLRSCLIIVSLGVVGLVCSITAQYFAAKASAGFAKKVKRALFSHIQSLSHAEIDRLGTSTLITRMTSDMNQVQSGVNLTLRLLLRSPFVVFGAMIMAFTIDVRAALVFAVAIPALSVVVFGIMLWCIPLYRRAQSKLDRVLALTRENLAGVRVLRAFRKERDEVRTFAGENEALTQVQKHVGRISALMNPLTYVILHIAVVALIWVGALRVEAGVLTQGAMVALYSYMTQILVELVKLASLIITITKSIACANRIQEVLEVNSSIASGEKAPPRAGDVAVEFRHVNLRYAGAGANALTDIDFIARAGETIGIIGGTGAGKSSLVHMIPRFYDAAEGSVRVDGMDVRDYPVESLRERIGFVPQKAVLFKGSVRENMRWGRRDATDAEIWDALAAAQARGFVEDKGGLDAPVEQGGRNFSGGQRQRLTIARALVRNPRILILDDSASALDFATDLALRRSIRALESKPTVFIVSQRASAVKHADNIIVLEGGGIVGMGKSDALLRDCAVYREIYHSQYRKEDAADG